uniref:Putative 52 kDa repressor of the inhibitor of the protein kinase n=1 Tax=Xenopsylla cheopis TaxID=163159 RepID=A0A6M2DID0_XENCH
MPKKKCYVPGCGSKSDNWVFHNFPTRNDKLFAIWVHRVGNSDLDELPISATKSRYICDKHFAPLCKSGSAYNKPLKVHALPTLDLPGFKENPQDASNCLLDRDTFQQGKSLNCAENKGKKWKYFREMGTLLDKKSDSGRIINTDS